MTLFEKIKNLYPSLVDTDFHPVRGTIMLQNDSNGEGDYIKSWEHPTHAQPTQAQLDAVE
jgi:hypothetical protein